MDTISDLFHIRCVSSLIESDYLRFVELKDKQLSNAWLKGTFHRQKLSTISLNATVSNKAALLWHGYKKGQQFS
ncbi:hypothetical protein VCR4J2_550119 [Vibrio coralliirubri]|nr:hypothetical protein VCR4J2_550119 [Vibrio coralliirubri]